MRRLGTLVSILAAVALVAGACGATGDGRLQALPRGGGGAGASTEAASAMVATDGSMDATRYHRPVEYEPGEGLGGVPDQALAYEMRGEATESDVIRLAGLLGLEGDVETDEGSHRVVDGDLTLEVARRRGAPWMVVNDAAEQTVSSCAVGIAVAPDGATSDDEALAEERAAVLCEEEAEPAPVEGLLSAGEAESRAREVIEGLDHDKIEFSYEAEQPSSTSTSVRVRAQIDGHDVELLDAWYAFGAEGAILHAHGWLGSFEAIGSYPLVDMAAAVDRLNEQGARFGGPEPMIGAVIEPTSESSAVEGGASSGAEPGFAGGASPECPPEADCVGPTEPSEQPLPDREPTPAPEPEPEPAPEVIVLEDVRLGYTTVIGGCEDDPVILVPSYVFTTPDGGELWVEAVTDEHLAPEPEGDEGVDRCGPMRDGGEPATEPGEVPMPEPKPMPAEEPAPAEAESKVATTSR